MYFVLLDSTGNLIASYQDEGEAQAALTQLIADDPAAGEDVALMTYDDEGEIAADPVFATPTVALTVHAESHDWYGIDSVSGDLSHGDRTRQIATAVG